MNFPTIEGQFCQVHLLANQKYLRSSRFNPQRLPVEVEDLDQGYAWVKLSPQKPSYQTRPGRLALDIHTNLNKRTIEIAPQEELESKIGGLAILYRKERNWQLILEIDWTEVKPFKIHQMI